MNNYSKSYIVKDDMEIAHAGYSGVSGEEKALLTELSQYSEKNQMACMILCICCAGFQYFYVGRIGRGVLYFLTGGFLLIGTLVDFFVIASGKFKDKDGKLLNNPRRFALEMKLDNYYRNVGEKKKAEESFWGNKYE